MDVSSTSKYLKPLRVHESSCREMMRVNLSDDGGGGAQLLNARAKQGALTELASWDPFV